MEGRGDAPKPVGASPQMASRHAASDITKKLLAACPVTGQVLALTDDGVVCSLGSAAGLAPGRELIVFRPRTQVGEHFFGAYAEDTCTLSGRVSVDSAEPDGCVAKILSGIGEIKEGDCVQLVLCYT